MWLGSLRQQTFGEIEALLCLAQLLPHRIDLDFERFDPGIQLASAAALPQAPGP